MEKETITLEDGRECLILNELSMKKTKYLVLVNINNSTDFIIRKKVGNDIVGLDNEKEFENVLKELTDSIKNN